MLIKKPQRIFAKFFKKGITAVLIVETICFAGTYTVWFKANTNRDFRFYLRQNFPSSLEYYYKTGELLDNKSNIRQVDLQIWIAEGKISN